MRDDHVLAGEFLESAQPGNDRLSFVDDDLQAQRSRGPCLPLRDDHGAQKRLPGPAGEPDSGTHGDGNEAQDAKKE